MPSHRRKLLPLCIAASLLSTLSMQAAAIGVGEIHLQSFLGAPLQAEIPLNHLDELSADQLKIQLGSQADYGAMGVDYSYLHSQFKIEPIVKNGRGYVRISTREPITEPYLNFVLNLRWPQGQLVREFTVLLDPPTQAVATIKTSTAAPTSSIAATTEPATDEASVVDASVAESRTAPRRQHRASTATPSADHSSEGSYTIQRGDSLWRIANRIRPAQVSVEQTMAAIQAINPNAFVNDNPSLLKEAVTIVLPDAQQIAAVATAGGSFANTESAAKSSESAVPRVKPSVEKRSESVVDNAADLASSPAVTELIEENSALKTQVNDLTGNVASLNENLVQSEQRLHQLEAQLNELIQQMQQQRATVAALSGNAEAQGVPLAQNSGSVINQVNAADLHGHTKTHTPWWVHLLYWLGISGAVVWAVREHFWPQRRLAVATIAGGSSTDSDNKSAQTGLMNRIASNTPARITTVKEAAELSLDADVLPDTISNIAEDNSEVAPQLLRASEEPVDASISAGVFVAFGRFSEAERLLKEALARDPTRIDLKLQLLDVLMQSDQPGAFDDLAAEIESEANTPETLAELAVLRDSYRSRN